MKTLVTRAVLAAIAVAVVSPAHALVIGTADGTSGVPFGDNTGNIGALFFQQIYSASAFGGQAIDINSISFYSPTGGDVGYDYKIYLTTTGTAVNSSFDTGTFDYSFLNTTTNPAGPLLDAWLLPDDLSDGRLDLVFSQSFHYDPTTMGNLMLSMSYGVLSSTALFNVDKGDTSVVNSRLSQGMVSTWDQGLVTGFNVAPVPVPAAVWLLGSGLAGLGAASRRRKVA